MKDEVKVQAVPLNAEIVAYFQAESRNQRDRFVVSKTEGKRRVKTRTVVQKLHTTTLRMQLQVP